MNSTFKICNCSNVTPTLSLRERNQCDHRIEEIAKRAFEISEITGQDHLMLTLKAAGINMHLVAEITYPCP